MQSSCPTPPPAILVKPPCWLRKPGACSQTAAIRRFATEFAGNWLGFRRFEEHNAVDRERFPSFTNELRQAMYEEPIRLFVDVVSRDRSVLDLLYGDDTFVNPGPGQALRHAGSQGRKRRLGSRRRCPTASGAGACCRCRSS